MLSISTVSRFAPAALAAFFLTLAGCSGGEQAAGGDNGAGANATTGGGGEAIDASITGALGEMIKGSADAPVTVIEYASVTCPHCATYHEKVYPAIKEKYIDTGKVRFVFREFPTPPAELSVVGSMVARCAADKGGSDAYFLVLGALFNTQKKWIYGDTRDELMKIASQAGLDQSEFEACVGRQDLVDLINGNVSSGRDQYEINSTPSFVVNGRLRHFSTVEDTSKALDEALENAEQ